MPSLDASVKWYSDNLGLAPTILPPTPEAKVALLRGPGLLVELVEHSESFPLSSRLPGLKGRYLVARGVRFKGDVYSDERARVRSILVFDADENVIQLFEPLRRTK